ncbi:hypothetical protein AA313_de0203667 [Arthrobotrys entomopaga]|nr:hypothetical protein AA313_de0203667 [Arthrobotrys entomopaga]
MPHAVGSVKSTDSGTKYTALFIVDDTQYALTGLLNPPSQSFSCTNAILEYRNPEDLTETQTFLGEIGATNLAIAFDNGTKISGPLEAPVMSKSTVTGQAVWMRGE